MKTQTNKSFRNITTFLAGSMLLVGTSAFAADNQSGAAPITYKMANPYASPFSALTTQQSPTAYNTSGTKKLLKSMAFDPSKVDPTLYNHQRVGKPYTVAGNTYYPAHDPSYDQAGVASWYGDKFHGKPTASGEIFDKTALTAAHKTLPLNSYVVVTNLQTGIAVKLRINDRGPFTGNRLIDLSEAAADVLGVKGSGLSQVRVQYAGPTQVNNQQPVAPAPQQAMKVPAPAPVQALPMPAPPQIAAPDYQPLRQMSASAAEPAPKSYNELPSVNVPNILMPAPVSPNAQPLPPIPEAFTPATPGQGSTDIETLTIKGPIHMASDRNTGPKAVWIPTVNRTVYRSKN